MAKWGLKHLISRKCRGCGAKFESQNQYCAKCEEKILEETREERNERQRTESRKHFLRSILVWCFITSLLVFQFYLLNAELPWKAVIMVSSALSALLTGFYGIENAGEKNTGEWTYERFSMSRFERVWRRGRVLLHRHPAQMLIWFLFAFLLALAAWITDGDGVILLFKRILG